MAYSGAVRARALAEYHAQADAPGVPGQRGAIQPPGAEYGQARLVEPGDPVLAANGAFPAVFERAVADG